MDTGSGQRKAPWGFHGVRGRLAYSSTVASKGREHHQGDEEGRKEEIAKGTKEVGHTAYLSAMSPQQQRR